MEITEALLKEIEKGYHNNPYHNFAHAKDVVEQIKKFTNSIPLILAGYLHDIGHQGGIARVDDEEVSVEISKKILEKHNIPENIQREVFRLILATKVINRYKLQQEDEKIIADCDISVLGRDFTTYFSTAIFLDIERNKGNTFSDEAILYFFEKKQFKTFGSQSIFLTKKGNILFHKVEANKQQLESLLQTKEGKKYIIDNYRKILKEPKIQEYLQN